MSRMTPRWPLRTQLRDPVDDVTVERCWRAIETRQRQYPHTAKGAVLGLVATAAVVLLVLFGAHLRAAFGPQVLLADDGTAFVRLVAPVSVSARQRFADGSTIEAAPNTALQGLASTPQEFSVLLERGAIEVSVTPGGPRRWVIEAKLARVEVVGTRFSVTRRDDGQVDIAVRQGVVLVRSALLAQGVERLSAGKTLRIVPPLANAQPTEPSQPSNPSALAEPQSPTLVPIVATAKAELSTLVAVPRETAATLMQKADAARVSGEVAKAEGLLERLVREFPADPQATHAAYTLGVVRLQRGNAAQAIDALRLALALQPPSSLQQDCYLRLIEAELAAGQRDQALATRQEYLSRFPAGRHRRALTALLGASGDTVTP